MDRTTWIFPQQMLRRDSRRPVVFLVAVLIHAGIIGTLADSARTRASRKKPDAVEPLRVIFIDSATPSASSASESAATPPPLSPLDLARASVTPVIPEIIPPPDDAPTTAPSLDWSTGMTAAARDAVTRQMEREAAPRIGAHPKGMKTPKRKFHAPGETTETGDGEVLTWVNDYCFYSNRMKPRSNGIGGVKPLCVDVPPPYQSLEDWVKSRRKLADERDDE